jgi:segregation and condensation protein B
MSDLEKPSINLIPMIHVLLFMAVEPVFPAQLASAMDVSTAEVVTGLTKLEEVISPLGLRLQWHAGMVQLTTAPELARLIERFLGLASTSHLTHAALDTIAIIAYQQPVTRPYIDGVRGVSSDGVIKSLLAKGLIREAGRADGPGRPILYGTTPDFLQYFGLNSLSELPAISLPEFQNDFNHDETLKG